jgi:quercetin dioxygenase-like cupin family protein
LGILAVAFRRIRGLNSENVNSDFATFIRTVVILLVAALIVYASGNWQQPSSVSTKTWVFLILSGAATGASWICYFRALILPDHEHVGIEQTYVLEGSLVDKEGPAKDLECKAGEFIWREQGSRHAAWSPQGVLMLATLRGPNKFFMADGRVIDGSGKDWDETWGHTRRA